MGMRLQIALDNAVGFDVRNVSQERETERVFDVVLAFDRVVQVIDEKRETDASDNAAKHAEDDRENHFGSDWRGRDRGRIDQYDVVRGEAAEQFGFVAAQQNVAVNRFVVIRFAFQRVIFDAQRVKRLLLGRFLFDIHQQRFLAFLQENGVVAQGLQRELRFLLDGFAHLFNFAARLDNAWMLLAITRQKRRQSGFAQPEFLLQPLDHHAVTNLRNAFNRLAISKNAINFGQSFIGLQHVHVRAAQFGFGPKQTLPHQV